MQLLSNGRLFPNVGPGKEKDLSPKVFLFVVGTRRVKLLEDERADERVCIYAVILTDTWDHLQKGSNDTEMRPSCTESYITLDASKGNREQE